MFPSNILATGSLLHTLNASFLETSVPQTTVTFHHIYNMQFIFFIADTISLIILFHYKIFVTSNFMVLSPA
jgi:hypothetical protein